MTDARPTPDGSAPRSATIRTAVEEPEVVAAAVRPDNTPEIDTRVERDADGVETVVTRIERGTTGGLRTTVDDYVVNLAVAQNVVQLANRHSDATSENADPSSANAETTSADPDATSANADVDRPETDHTQP